MFCYGMLLSDFNTKRYPKNCIFFPIWVILNLISASFRMSPPHISYILFSIDWPFFLESLTPEQKIDTITETGWLEPETNYRHHDVAIRFAQLKWRVEHGQMNSQINDVCGWNTKYHNRAICISLTNAQLGSLSSFFFFFEGISWIGNFICQSQSNT